MASWELSNFSTLSFIVCIMPTTCWSACIMLPMLFSIWFMRSWFIGEACITPAKGGVAMPLALAWAKRICSRSVPSIWPGRPGCRRRALPSERSFLKGSSFSTTPPRSCPIFIFSALQRFCTASQRLHGRFRSIARSQVRRSRISVLTMPWSSMSFMKRSVWLDMFSETIVSLMSVIIFCSPPPSSSFSPASCSPLSFLLLFSAVGTSAPNCTP
mmetsp:Transcript_49308/g.88593  ORF Transcript_49308/g.88593 Transcript_49308/m.88593 type:complete len:214 (+) Transcript_49308:1502-2143(+)